MPTRTSRESGTKSIYSVSITTSLMSFNLKSRKKTKTILLSACNSSSSWAISSRMLSRSKIRAWNTLRRLLLTSFQSWMKKSRSWLIRLETLYFYLVILKCMTWSRTLMSSRTFLRNLRIQVKSTTSGKKFYQHNPPTSTTSTSCVRTSNWDVSSGDHSKNGKNWQKTGSRLSSSKFKLRRSKASLTNTTRNANVWNRTWKRIQSPISLKKWLKLSKVPCQS